MCSNKIYRPFCFDEETVTRLAGFSALKKQLLPQLTEDFRENLIIQ